MKAVKKLKEAVIIRVTFLLLDIFCLIYFPDFFHFIIFYSTSYCSLKFDVINQRVTVHVYMYRYL
jgi:hypothetical protein